MISICSVGLQPLDFGSGWTSADDTMPTTDQEVSLAQAIRTVTEPAAAPDLRQRLLGESRVRRPRSAPTALLLVERLLSEMLRRQAARGKTGLLICTQTSCTQISFREEKLAAAQGWSLFDPFALPYTIPSVFGSELAFLHAFTGPVATLLDSDENLVTAFLLGRAMLRRGRVDDLLILAVEYLEEVHRLALSRLNLGATVAQGAVGFHVRSAEASGGAALDDVLERLRVRARNAGALPLLRDACVAVTDIQNLWAAGFAGKASGFGTTRS